MVMVSLVSQVPVGLVIGGSGDPGDGEIGGSVDPVTLETMVW